MNDFRQFPCQILRDTLIICIQILFASIVLLFPYSSHAQTNSENDLANDPQWLAFLHTEVNSQSKIKPSPFFLSTDGNINPKAELSATIAALKTAGTKTQCFFPARYEWLSDKLPEIKQLPKETCADLEEWLAALNPERITLIFASAFVNNPASAFGHTFLRLDQKDSEDLLSYTANYAAATQGEDSLTYAYKGIFGGYDGFFSVTPYYQRVKEYSDLENRDIWEYELSLDKTEVRRLVLHLWELRNTPATYYYFDENCSYKIIELLNVARPSLNLTSNFNFWVIPVDSVRITENLITGTRFRPSAQSLLQNRINLSSQYVRSRALEIADPTVDFSLKNEEPETLDLAYELIIYRKISGMLAEEVANKRAFAILAARGAHPKIDSVPAPLPPSVRPEQGHKSAQLSISEGKKDNYWFTRFAIRPAFHDLMDPQLGYQKGAQINFFELALDVTEEEEIDISHFTALEITSLTPRNEFFNPLSWNVRTGLKRNIIEERDDSLTTYLGGGFGRSWGNSDKTLVYTLIDSEVRANKYYQSEFNPGTGARIGLLSYFQDNWALNAEVQWLRFIDQTALNSNLSIRYAAGVSSNIVAKVSEEREYDTKTLVSTLGFEWFFTP